MKWFEPVWLYCERGTSTALLAEPVNSVATLSYLVAGLAALWIYRKLPATQKSADHLLLIALMFIAGFGGLSFHLFASQWSELAHLLPPLFFVLVYLAFALNSFLKVPAGWTVLAALFFAIVTIAAMTMVCPFLDKALQPDWSVAEGRPVAQQGGATSCLNGSFTYFPAIIALTLVAFGLRKKRHQAAKSLWLAVALFIVSLVFLTIDHLVCSLTQLTGYQSGTHYAWHLLNAIAMFILARSSLLHQDKPLAHEIIPPDGKASKGL